MKLNVNLKTTVLGKNKKAYEYNGRNGVSYKAVCMVNDNGNTVTDEISVTEEVFHSLEDMKPYDLYGLSLIHISVQRCGRREYH